MDNLYLPEKKRLMEFAFVKFFSKKHPVCAERRLNTSSQKGPYHNHDFPQLLYCMSGRYFHKVGDQVYECTKGSLVMVPPGVHHKFRLLDGECAEILFLNVTYDIFIDTDVRRYINAVSTLFLPPFARDLGHAFPIHQMLSKGSQAAFEEYTSWLSLLDFREPGTVDKRDILENLEQLFSLPELALPESCRQKAVKIVTHRLIPVLHMLRYLNSNYPEDIQEEQLMRTSGTCRTNLYSFFKQYTGSTYSQYLQALRAKHVHVYLSRTTYPISYISDMCGFCNTQHMSRTYKKYTGKSPRESRLYLYKLHNRK